MVATLILLDRLPAFRALLTMRNNILHIQRLLFILTNPIFDQMAITWSMNFLQAIEAKGMEIWAGDLLVEIRVFDAVFATGGWAPS